LRKQQNNEKQKFRWLQWVARILLVAGIFFAFVNPITMVFSILLTVLLIVIWIYPVVGSLITIVGVSVGYYIIFDLAILHDTPHPGVHGNPEILLLDAFLLVISGIISLTGALLDGRRS
jgi:hypothetical protein